MSDMWEATGSAGDLTDKTELIAVQRRVSEWETIEKDNDNE